MEKAFIIFSGYNTRAITSFCRRLTVLGRPFYIIAANKNDFIFYTAYKKNVFAIRSEKELVWDELKTIFHKLQKTVPQNDFILCPSSEYLNHYALRHQAQFAEFNINIPLVDLTVYDKITNKYSFSTLCKKKGLDIPKRLRKISENKIPFVAKPKKNIGQGNTLYPHLILCKNDYDIFMKNESTEQYYFEEFLSGGESYYLLFYISPFGKNISFSQKNILQQAGGKSIVYAIPADIHNQPISNQYVTILRQSGFWGLIMIELKKMGEQYVMIEANPRLWGPSQLFVDNNQPLFDAFIHETTTNEPYRADQKQRGRQKPYIWLGGVLQQMYHGQKMTWHSAKDSMMVLRGVLQDVYLRRDTWPFFFKELQLIINNTI
ncbi:MAG TPA: hypothetical protein ENK44_05630 [Caldithrix abyssi]|uniref:ATP-grasp domain-containing protein n=1 Tax=Caldithrix abyssi TaxID=187145 RepID=A0A7V4WUS5_CALAY|nr:hypothetical protein [Caldithrix abyssi]